MALLVVEVITRLNLIQYSGLGEVTKKQGRSLETESRPVIEVVADQEPLCGRSRRGY